MLRITFLWDWEPEYYQALTWEDGLAAAIKELAARHTVQVLTTGKRNVIHNRLHDIQVSDDVVADVQAFNPDVILIWADMTRPHAEKLKELGKPMAICFAGGEVVTHQTPLFDHIFVESEVYKKKLEETGYDNVSIAFGTNTDLFTPLNQPKVFDTIFPATFAAWKRHDLYAKAVNGLSALACGYMYQDHEQDCWQVCVDNGVTILPHVSGETLRYLYAASKACVVTSGSDGGSQRTVLEAMAMNVPVIITDSDKFDFARGIVFETDPTPQSIRGYLNAIIESPHWINTRDYVLDKWSHITYANALQSGLERIL